MKSWMVIGCVLAMAVWACEDVKSKTARPRDAKAAQLKKQTQLEHTLAAQPQAPAVVIDASTKALLQKVARSNNAFGVDIYNALRKRPGNTLLSPSSTMLALAMTYGGARGKTAREMERTLHLLEADSPIDAKDRKVEANVFKTAEEVHQGLGALSRLWKASSSGYTLKVANRIFLDERENTVPAFSKLLERDYAASVGRLDFAYKPEQGRDAINQWAAQQTAARIVNLLPSRAVTSETTIVLTNAIYFKGDWLHRFDAQNTTPGLFYATDKALQVPMMTQQQHFRYGHVDDVEVLELPYTGDEMALDIILPPAQKGLSVIENSLTSSQLEKWLDALSKTPQKVSVTLPKFKVASPSIALSGVLKALGMLRAFGKADFSGMSRNVDGIGEVYHKTFLEVNEQGAEAAAASAVLLPRSQKHPVFKADHPFMFLIRDLRSGVIVFLGRVSDPTLVDATQTDDG